MPKFQRDMDYLPIEDIDFTSAKHKKRKLDEAIDTNNLPVISSNSTQDPVCEVSTEEEKEYFLQRIKPG